MFKERIKSSVIFLLILNLFFLASETWFLNNPSFKNGVIDSLRTLPVIRTFVTEDPPYSFPKENLSRPRKFLINDGSLWMAYYNTDIGFSPIEERSSAIIKGFLKGDTKEVQVVDNLVWEAALESLSIYVEYPISFSFQMFCKIMDCDFGLIKENIGQVQDFVILPSTEEENVCLLVRDALNPATVYAYMLDDKYSLPQSDLMVYTDNGDGYYQPAFSTGLQLGSKSNIELEPLVLFSDSQPDTQILAAQNLIEESSHAKLLNALSFNSKTMNNYQDNNGAIHFIENFASAKIYPDSLFEYAAVSPERGIVLDQSGDAYNVVNASIDFVEKIWGCVSQAPLNVLVSSDLSDYKSDTAYTLNFDYYCNGRPVEINLQDKYGHEEMTSAIEMTVLGGKLISYRHYMRSYNPTGINNQPEAFLSALDSFVHQLENDSAENKTITDIYIGYLDDGKNNMLNASWLAADGNSKVYSSAETAVNDNELDQS